MEIKITQRARVTDIDSEDGSLHADIHESTFSTYKAGSVTMVRLETLDKLANYFGCQAGDLLHKEAA